MFERVTPHAPVAAPVKLPDSHHIPWPNLALASGRRAAKEMPMPDKSPAKTGGTGPTGSRRDGWAIPPVGRPARKVEMTQIVARSRQNENHCTARNRFLEPDRRSCQPIYRLLFFRERAREEMRHFDSFAPSCAGMTA